MSHSSLIPYSFGHETAARQNIKASSLASRVEIEEVTGTGGRLKACIRVFEEAIYEVALLNERQRPFYQRFIQLREGRVVLEIPLAGQEKKTYSFQIGKLAHSTSYRSLFR